MCAAAASVATVATMMLRTATGSPGSGRTPVLAPRAVSAKRVPPQPRP
jgi:hypothetical protein